MTAATGTVPRDARANPMAGNPLVTKDDVQRAAVDLVEPIVPYLSEGGAQSHNNAASLPQADVSPDRR